MKTTNEQLTAAWAQVYEGAAKAVQWVNEVRPSSRRLESEADNLVLDLRRLRNTARKLGEVSAKSVAVGFFGLSQAGKSYLISALAAGENGKLETAVEGQVLDFIDHINPPGGGKEATGLVTRFSRTARGGISGYPLELKLFQEIEIVKILMNAYFKDFDQQRIMNKIALEDLSTILQPLERQKLAQRVSGISEDDIVDLYDYASENFANSIGYLKGGFWEKATRLAPHLALESRATLFSLLWGGVPELSAAYIELASTLTKLQHADKVYAPLSVLVQEQDGKKTQDNSIMNVDMLERFNTPRDSLVEVTPYQSHLEQAQTPVTISLAQLAILTAELTFPLVNKTRVETFETVDLLDFPGYRGRLSLIELSDVKEGNPISQLLLRGKVAYLFERYTDSQEMNVLIVCTPSDKQSDVNDVGPVLARWIDKTQGETPEKRANKMPGLLWAITMFDKRIVASLTHSDEMLKNYWGRGGLLQQTILERFGSFDWLANWQDGHKFDNVYLVRKPGFRVPFITIDNQEHELAFNEQYTDKLETMRRTFIEDADIQNYVAQPGEAWDAMLCLNDGGMARVSNYLKQVALPEVKQRRIIEQLNERINYIVNTRFDTWYQAESAEALSKKNQIIGAVVKDLQSKALLLGELLNVLALPEATIRALYYSNDYNAKVGQLTEESNLGSDNFAGFGLSGGFDLFAEPSTAVVSGQTPADRAPDSQFAKAVFSAWIEHMRNIILDKHVVQFLGYTPKHLAFIVEELITAANRLKVETQLTTQILANEDTGSKRDELASRQISTIHTQLADFIAWLGVNLLADSEIPTSRIEPNRKVFSYRPLEQQNGLPKLTETSKNYTQRYVFDWFVAFMKLAQENIGHSAGREITQEQNIQLGQVLTHFTQAQLSEALS